MMKGVVHRTIALLIVLLVASFSALPQDSSYVETEDETFRQLNGVGFVPSKANQINGLAIGWLFMGFHPFDNDGYEINGLYLNPSPVQAVFAAFAAPYLVLSPLLNRKRRKSQPKFDSITWNIAPATSKVNGVAIDLLELGDEVQVNGIQVSGLGHVMHGHRGVSLAGLFNASERARGFQLAGLFNSTDDMKGLQIGLVNTAVEMKGVQIGLWNQIGRRGFPLIHVRLGDSKQKGKK
jgi:hypothetical protein